MMPAAKLLKFIQTKSKNPPLDSMHTVSVNIDAINYGEYITSFFYVKALQKPTPMSGGFTLKINLREEDCYEKD
ncbi:MAG: hypothetical protein L6V93_01940 [Clostridiales bacterium]|nr:MAG: hypothetical protein L6V93_01940 [Clostridiales bacterium]